ncbi:MAG: hypothetical protein KKD01_19545 [Proteobacteria bacterium]|nr:hypothetical protein [Pseudomonadota bacterium]
MHKHNVKISKDVVYVMSDLLEAGIFASKMEWDMKEPVVILHLNLDNKRIKRDMNIGAYSSWFEYHGNIPPSSITKVEHFNQEFKIKHAERLRKRFK